MPPIRHLHLVTWLLFGVLDFLGEGFSSWITWCEKSGGCFVVGIKPVWLLES
jgi:hypothetical protein